MSKFTAHITTASGNHYATTINAFDEKAVRDYYFNCVQYYITEDYNTGEESRDKIVKVDVSVPVCAECATGDNELLIALGVQS